MKFNRTSLILAAMLAGLTATASQAQDSAEALRVEERIAGGHGNIEGLGRICHRSLRDVVIEELSPLPEIVGSAAEVRSRLRLVVNRIADKPGADPRRSCRL